MTIDWNAFTPWSALAGGCPPTKEQDMMICRSGKRSAALHRKGKALP